MFGVPPQESQARFREAVKIVLAAWQNERLTWDGDYWHFKDVEVLPKPLQQPHPHTWIAVGSPDSVCWAAAQGYSIMLGPHTHYTDLGQKRESLQEGTGGTRPHHRRTRYSRWHACSPWRETEQAAEAIARQGRHLAGGIVCQSRQSCQGCGHGNRAARPERRDTRSY